MEIKSQDYAMSYDAASACITCTGSWRLSGMEEYAPIIRLFNDIAEQEPEKLTLNLRLLRFLNSSGINVLSKFVIKVRQKKNIQIVVQGTKQFPWQNKSLRNLQRLMPSLVLEFE
ncbi:MAG: hypothetical protein GY862_14355 [Gammaproteobacteria bacterium]|nr:hypothetical protein [Gammaproteobacteria bacterium]